MSKRQGGFALLVMLVILMAVTASASSFIWYMNQAQARSGARYRDAAAAALAEAGVHRALAILESLPGAPAASDVADGSSTGGFSIDIADGGDGEMIVTSTGEFGGVGRRIRARVVLASPALLAAIYSASTVRLEPGAETFLVPYNPNPGGSPSDGTRPGDAGSDWIAARDRPWVHIAARRGLWLSTRNVSVNEPLGAFDTSPGPVDGPLPAATRAPAPLRILLSREADLVTEPDLRRTELHRLRTLGANVDGEVRRVDAFPAAPQIDRAYWRAAAAANTANAALHQAAGEYLLDQGLAQKTDSVYTAREFERLLDYLATGRRAPVLRGVVYVTGEVALAPGRRLRITDGALIADDWVQIGDQADLRIIHSAATRALPGLLVLDPGRLTVGRGARLDVHGLVFVGRVFDMIYGAQVHIVGSVIAADPVIGFNNLAATAVIRYDPAVLGTRGLRVPAGSPVVAWVAVWEERP